MINERKAQRKELVERVIELEKILKKEQKDVDKLEKKTATSLFYNLIGRMEQKHNKEKQEELAAAFKYNLAKDELQNIDIEISNMISEVRELKDASTLCKQAFDTKVEYIKSNNLPQAEELVQIESKIIYFQSQQKEIKEAMDVARRVLVSAERVQSRLDDAQGWATLDTLGIFDTLSWISKKQSLDEAQDYIADLHRNLAKLKTELKDVNMAIDVSRITDGFAGYSDLIFDSFLFDILTSSKISSASKDVKKIHKQVVGIYDELKKNHSMLTNKNRELQQDYESLIYSM
jgi:hypothetical protein